MHHPDSLFVTKENFGYARTLTSVGGDLVINAENAGLTALTSVGGRLYVSAANAGLTALTNVGGDVSICADASGLTSLTSVGGSLYIYAANSGLTALTSIRGILLIRTENPGLTSLTSLGGEPFIEPTPEVAAQRLQAVARAVLAEPGALNMSWWHCGTSHCIAGWAIHLAGEEGYALEKAVGAPNAGAMLLGLKAAEMFFLDTKTARARLQRLVLSGPHNPRPGAPPVLA